MTRFYLSEITGNPADDGFAISAGTNQKIGFNAATFGLPVNSVISSTGALTIQQINPVDVTGGPFTVTLPPTGLLTYGALVAVQKIDVTTNLVTVSGTIRGNATTRQLYFTGETVLFFYEGGGSYREIAGDRSIPQLDTRYLTVGSADAMIPGHINVKTTSLDLNRAWFDGVTSWAGVSPGQDITTQIQAAINFLLGTTTGQTGIANLTSAASCEIYFSKAGTYNINGAVVNGSVANGGASGGAYNYAAQILLPGVQGLGIGGSIKLRGLNKPVWSGTTSQPGVVLLSNAGSGARTDTVTCNGTTTVTDASAAVGDVGKSVSGANVPLNTVVSSVSAGVSFVASNAMPATVTSLAIGGGEIFSTIPAGSGVYPALTHLLFQIEDIHLENSTKDGGGLDLYSAGGFNIRRLQVINTTGTANGGINSTRKAITCPHQIQNSDQIVDNVGVNGYLTGFQMAEHVVFEGFNFIASCQNAFDLVGGGGTISIHHAWVTGCRTTFNGIVGASHIAANIMWEDGGLTGFGSGGRLLNDPLSVISGTVKIGVGDIFGVSTMSLPGVCGGAGQSSLLDVGLSTGGPTWRNTHPVDTFLRELPGLSNADNPGFASETWHPWRVGTGLAAMDTVVGNVSNANALTQLTITVPAKNGRYGSESRAISATFTTGSVYTGFSVLGHSTFGNTGGAKKFAINLSSGVNVNLQVPGTGTVQTLAPAGGAALAANSTYIATLIIVMGGDGLPSRGRILWQAQRTDSACTGAGTTTVTDAACLATDVGRVVTLNSTPRVDSSCGLNSTTTVTDASILASDVNSFVTGANIQGNTVINSVTPGVSFVMSKAATATASPVALTFTPPVSPVSGIPAGTVVQSVTAGVSFVVNNTIPTGPWALVLTSPPIELCDHQLTTAERAAAVATPNNKFAPIEDGLQWSSTDVGTKVSNFTVRPLAQDDVVDRDQIIGLTQAGGGTLAIDASAGSWQTITVNDGTAFVVGVPSNPPDTSITQELTLEVFNNSGGVLGAITYAAGTGSILLAGITLTNPASTKKRWIRFRWNGTRWVGQASAGADY